MQTAVTMKHSRQLGMKSGDFHESESRLFPQTACFPVAFAGKFDTP